MRFAGHHERALSPHGASAPSGLARIAFAVIVFGYVVVLCSFRHAPTYDGPDHLASAVIWAGFDNPARRYREFYVIEPKHVPNLTSQFALAGMVRVMPPLIAEKVLVTVYLAGAAAAFWYFATAFGADARWLAPLALPFVLNGAFLAGFYNYCLSLVVLWYTAGYCARKSKLRARDAIWLAGVLTVAFWTHLVGWLLAVAAAFWFLALRRGERARSLVYLMVAAAPSLALAFDYGARTAMFGEHGVRSSLADARGGLGFATIERRLAAWGSNVFGPVDLAGSPFGVAMLVLYELLIAASFLSTNDSRATVSWKRPAALAALVFAGYCILPDDLGQHGGFLLVRLAFLPPMLLVAALRLPEARGARRVLLGLVYAAVCVNMALTACFFRRANADIEEYVAGIGVVGKNAAIFTAGGRGGREPPDYLKHAASYYALTTGNIALENCHGQPGPFWVQLRPDVSRGCGDFEHYSNKEQVDFVLAWSDRRQPVSAPAGCREVFSQGRLHVFATPRALRRDKEVE